VVTIRPMTEATPGRRARGALPWASAAFAFAVSLRQISDPDYWTHLALGRAFIQAGSLHIDEPFLLTVRGAVEPLSWPFQILAYGVRSAGGEPAVSVLVAAAAAGAFLLLARLLPPSAGPWQCGAALVWLALAASVARFRFTPRPEALGYLLLALSLVLASRWARAPSLRTLGFLALLFLGWRALHVSWALGAAFVGLQLALEPRVDFWREAWRRRRVVPLAAAAAGLALAAAGALRFAAFVLAELARGGLLHGVTEMRPTWEFPPVLWPYLGVSALALAMALTGRRGRWRRLALWAAALALGLAVVRNAAFALLAMAAPALDGIGRGRAEVLPRLARRPAGAAVLLTLAALLGVAWRDPDPPPGWGVPRLAVPADAAAFVKERGLAGPVFNSWDLGGYLDWAWNGSPRTFLDGRLADPALIADEEALVSAAEPEAVLSRRGFRTVLLQALYRNSGRLAPAVPWLLAHPGWRLVRASDALVFARVPLPEGLRPLAAAEAWRHVLRMAEVARTSRPEPEHALYSRALALWQLGDPAAAEAAAEAVAAHPELAGRYGWMR